MKLQELSNIMGENQFAKFTFHCCDCNKVSVVKCKRTGPKEIEITGGAILSVPAGWDVDEPYIGKCEACFKEDPHFHPPTSVYSRVVGYMRPVSGWNDAKQEEFRMRKVYDIASK